MTAFSFVGTIAPLQTAIMIASDGGWRVKVDIPANQEGAALELLTMRGKVLKITIEEDIEGIGGERSKAVNRRNAKERI